MYIFIYTRTLVIVISVSKQENKTILSHNSDGRMEK